MKQPDIDKVVKAVLDAVEKPLAAFEKRLSAVEMREPVPGPIGPGGVGVTDAIRDSDDCVILTLSDGRTKSLGSFAGRDGKDGEPGQAGKDADPIEFDDIAAAIRTQSDLVEAAVKGYLEEHPPKDGRDGVDGKSVDTDAIAEQIDAAVLKAVEAIPTPTDGADGRNGVDGKDGRSPTGLAINRDGDLLVTWSDGRQENVGRVVGKDGDGGTAGADGRDGKDGRDGLGFEDMVEELADDGRTIIRRYKRGELSKEFRHSIAMVLDRGVYKEGNYVPGDGVTWGGSFWIAQVPTTAKPGEGNSDWRLAVKRGRDGKSIEEGEIRRMVSSLVAQAISKVPKDGK